MDLLRDVMLLAGDYLWAYSGMLCYRLGIILAQLLLCYIIAGMLLVCYLVSFSGMLYSYLYVIYTLSLVCYIIICMLFIPFPSYVILLSVCYLYPFPRMLYY